MPATTQGPARAPGSPPVLPWDALAVAAAVTVAFLPAMAGGFVWDDNNDIVNSNRLRSWQSLIEVFRHPAVWAADRAVEGVATFRPLALASMVIDHQLWGLWAPGWHLTSILLHALAQALVWRLFGALGVPLRARLLMVGFTALHPTVVEAVAWVNGRSEPIALAGGAAALLLAVRAGTWGVGRVLGCAGCLFLALLGKETGALFALLVPVTPFLLRRSPPDEDHQPAPGIRAHRPWGAVVAAAAGVAPYVALRAHALGGGTLPAGPSHLGAVLVALPALWFRALQAVVVPSDRSIAMLGAWLRGLGTAELVAYVIGTAVLTALVGWAARRTPLVAFGWAWWVLALAPASLLVVSDWPGLNRWLYVGLPGLALVAWKLGQRLVQRRGARFERRAGYAAAAGVVLCLVLTERAIPVWASDQRLFGTMIEEQPDHSYGYLALGIDRYHAGHMAQAAALLDRAAELGSPWDILPVYRALALAEVDRCGEAARLFRPQRGRPETSWAFLEALGRCRARAGDHAGARQALEGCAAQFEPCARARQRLDAGDGAR